MVWCTTPRGEGCCVNLLLLGLMFSCTNQPYSNIGTKVPAVSLPRLNINDNHLLMLSRWKLWKTIQPFFLNDSPFLYYFISDLVWNAISRSDGIGKEETLMRILLKRTVGAFAVPVESILERIDCILMCHVSINNSNWTEWRETWSELLHVISKAREQRNFHLKILDRMISEQNSKTLSSITTLLHPFLNHTI